MGLSILTTKPISRPEYSQIRNHSEETNHHLISQSMLIAKYKPDLKVQTRSHPLYTV